MPSMTLHSWCASEKLRSDCMRSEDNVSTTGMSMSKSGSLTDATRFFNMSSVDSPGRESRLEHHKAAEQAFWPSLIASPQKRLQSEAISSTPSAPDMPHAFDIYSEKCSEYTEDGEVSDWTIDDGSPRKKRVSPRKKMRVALMKFQKDSPAQDGVQEHRNHFQHSLVGESQLQKLAAVVEDGESLGCQTFVVSLERLASSRTLGLNVEFEDRESLEVMEIHDGLISDWNASNPDKAVRVGDQIVNINGVTEDTYAMLDMVRRTGIISLVVARHNYDTQRLVSDLTLEQMHRRLCDLLWYSGPMWKPKDLLNAERKLRKVSIETIDDLSAVLFPERRMSNSSLNEQLLKCGEQPFSTSTLKEFRMRLKQLARDPRSIEATVAIPPPGCDCCMRSKERLLWDILWIARPQWNPSDLCAADRKLSTIGVNDVGALQEALRATGGINSRLRKMGAKVFTSDTVRALREYTPDEHQALLMFLYEARPRWKSQEVAAAQRKLAQVGVKSVGALSEALSEGKLRLRLQDAGFKSFTQETISAFRRQLETMYRVPGSSGGG